MRLGDVANVHAGTEEQRTAAVYNGEKAVGIDIVKSKGYSTTAVAEQYVTKGEVGVQEPDRYRALGPLIIGYMVIPMLVATILTFLLLWFRPAAVPRWMIWLALALQLVVWVSTFAIQLPIQGQLSADGLSLPLIDRLRATSFWFRRVPHTANAFLFLWMMSVSLRGNVRRSAEAQAQL